METFCTEVTVLVDKGGMTVIICLDLCQMFDTVLHNTLDSKLERQLRDGQLEG